MASTGFAGGLAGGLEAGINLKQRQQEIDSQNQYRQDETDRANQQLGLQQQQYGLVAAKAAYDITSQQKQALTQQVAASAQRGDYASAGVYGDQLKALQQQQDDAAAKINSYIGNARQGQQQIAEGTPAENMDPHMYSNAISAQIGRPAIDLVDRPGAPSPIGQASQTFHAGVQNNDGQGMIDGAHGLFGHTLQPLVGQQTYDGSTVTGAQLAPPVPHATSPDHLHPMVQITTQHPDNGTGTQYVPLMQDMNHMLLHPEDASNGNVLNTNIHAITQQAAMMGALHRAVNADPAAVAAIQQAHDEGATGNQQQMNTLLGQLGIGPAPQTVVVDPRTGSILYKAQPNQKVVVAPRDYSALDQARIEEYNAQADRARRPSAASAKPPTPYVGSDGNIYYQSGNSFVDGNGQNMPKGVKPSLIGKQGANADDKFAADASNYAAGEILKGGTDAQGNVIGRQQFINNYYTAHGRSLPNKSGTTAPAGKEIGSDPQAIAIRQAVRDKTMTMDQGKAALRSLGY